MNETRRASLSMRAMSRVALWAPTGSQRSGELGSQAIVAALHLDERLNDGVAAAHEPRHGFLLRLQTETTRALPLR